MAALDLDLVRHALSVAREHGYAQVELQAESGSFSARLERVTKAKKTGETEDQEETISTPAPSFIRSSMVGYYQQTPLTAGQELLRGDVVAIITALGIPNEILAAQDGTVEEILVVDGDPVEYGMPLVRFNPK